MGFFSDVLSTVFGGVDTSAQDAQAAANAAAAGRIDTSTRQARQDILDAFPRADVSRNLGFQGALDILGQSIPQQLQAFQAGNVGAQGQVAAGLPQFQAAILGQPTDFSAFQPSTIPFDAGFTQQTLPFGQPAQQAQQAQQVQALIDALSGASNFSGPSTGAFTQGGAEGGAGKGGSTGASAAGIGASTSTDTNANDFSGLNKGLIGGLLGGLLGPALGIAGKTIGTSLDVAEAKARLEALGLTSNLSAIDAIAAANSLGLIGTTTQDQLGKAITDAFGLNATTDRTAAQLGLGLSGFPSQATALRQSQLRGARTGRDSGRSRGATASIGDSRVSAGPVSRGRQGDAGPGGGGFGGGQAAGVGAASTGGTFGGRRGGLGRFG